VMILRRFVMVLEATTRDPVTDVTDGVPECHESNGAADDTGNDDRQEAASIRECSVDSRERSS